MRSVPTWANPLISSYDYPQPSRSGIYTPPSVNDLLMQQAPGSAFDMGSGWRTPSSSSHPLMPSFTFNVNAGGDANGAAAGQGIQTLRSTKNPALQSAIDAVLGQTSSLSSDPTRNEYTIKANTKDAGQASRIEGAANRFGSDVASNRETLDDFTRNYLASNPQAKGLLDQESGAIGDWFGTGPNSVQGGLDKLASQRRIAVAGATDQALRRTQAAANAARLLSGDSSYITSQFGGTAADILAREARDQADLARTNFMAVRGAQPALAGRRAALLNEYLMRNLAPIEANQRLGANELGQLGQIGSQIGANTIYNVDTPETMLSRKLALLSQLGGMDLANNFYGTSKPHDSDVSGYPRFNYGAGRTLSAPNFPSWDTPPFANPGSDYMGHALLSGGSARPGLDEATRWKYYNQTGFDPSTDPNLSDYALGNIQRSNAGRWSRNLPNGPGRSVNPLLPSYDEGPWVDDTLLTPEWGSYA